MISITESAVAAVNRFIESSGKDIAGLRIKVDGGGCSGLQYGLKLEEEIGETDLVENISGLTMLMDEESKLMLDGVSIDFLDTMEGSGFKFENPNAKNSCGCGKSFSA
jgi:iron-sulfur cluster assembly protein